MTTVTILKMIMPFVVIGILFYINWRIKQRKEEEEESKKITYEHGTYYKNLVPPEFNYTLSKVPEDVKEDNLKVFMVKKGKTIIAITLYSWPSGLWEFRKKRGELDTLNSYAHLFSLEVRKGFRGKGLMERMMDEVISETHRISSGLTMDTEDEFLGKRYEFKNGILSYENWGRLR